MKAQLKEFIVKQFGREPEGLDQVLNAFRPVYAKKNEVLVEIGETCRYCYFIVEGCLKVAAHNFNGDESTTSLAFEGEWRTAMQSFINQEPSNERVVAVEPTSLMAINWRTFQQFSTESLGFSQVYKSLLESSYTQSVERVQTLMGMDALDRLKWLLSIHPLIFTRLSNRLIASYLGLSEATLSRLKTKL